jgi:hypothetical protein
MRGDLILVTGAAGVFLSNLTNRFSRIRALGRTRRMKIR